jgi:hypothetical protein
MRRRSAAEQHLSSALRVIEATLAARLSGQSASRLVDNSRLASSIAPAPASSRASGRISSKSGYSATPRTDVHLPARTRIAPRLLAIRFTD